MPFRTSLPHPESIMQTPIATAPPAPAGQIASIAALQDQVHSLSQHLANLEAQRTALLRQISSLPPSSEQMRPSLRAQQFTLDHQIIRVQMDLAGARAEMSYRHLTAKAATVTLPALAAQSGNPGALPGFMSIPPRMYRAPFIDGRRGTEIIFILAVLLPISIGIMRRLAGGARRAPPAARPDVDSQRLERLEHAVESIAIEVERISEGQRFVTKVFASSAGRGARNADSGKNVESSALDDAGVLRALGAAPVEPIRMPDRQAVRPSITPH